VPLHGDRRAEVPVLLVELDQRSAGRPVEHAEPGPALPVDIGRKRGCVYGDVIHGRIMFREAILGLPLRAFVRHFLRFPSFGKSVANRQNHVVPRAGDWLTKQAGGRVPGRVRPFDHPAPIGGL